MSLGSKPALARRRWLIAFCALVALAIGLGVWSVAIEPNRLVMKSVDLPLPTWPASHPPLKVALLADLHAGAPFMTAEKSAEFAALTIAGHTHGGQVNLPLVGRLVVPSDYGQRYAYGHVDEEGRNLFVTAGIGTSILPVRFNQPPEIVILTVRSASD